MRLGDVFDMAWAILAYMVLPCVVLFGGIAGVESYACHAAWRHSGMRSEYSYFSGCMIEVAPGRVIPADRYREVK